MAGERQKRDKRKTNCPTCEVWRAGLIVTVVALFVAFYFTG